MSLKDKILSTKVAKSEKMDIAPGLTVEVRGMSGRTREKFFTIFKEHNLASADVDEAAKLVALMPLFPHLVQDGVFDPETGKRVFDRDDFEAIQGLDGEMQQAIAIKVVQLSGLGQKAVDEAGKSSSSTESAGSTSS